MAETENQTRLRRAREALAACRTAEDEAVNALLDARVATKRARERCDDLFLAEERAEAV